MPSLGLGAVFSGENCDLAVVALLIEDGNNISCLNFLRSERVYLGYLGFYEFVLG